MKSNPDKATLQNDGKKHEVADIFRRYGEASTKSTTSVGGLKKVIPSRRKIK